MNSEILTILDNAVDLLTQEYKNLGLELTQAFKNSNEQEYKKIDDLRDQVKALLWKIKGFQETVAPDLYLEN